MILISCIELLDILGLMVTCIITYTDHILLLIKFNYPGFNN